MALKERKYLYDVAVLKTYGNRSKITLHKVLRNKGVEDTSERKIFVRGSVNDDKMLESIIRAKSKIFEYAICNDWDYFITLTIDGKKYDRTNLKDYYKTFAQWLRDYQKKYKITIKYLLVPELHSDNKSWHMHGLIYGLPYEHLQENSNGYLDWLPYQKKFGYCSIDFIKDKNRVASYITKYVSKGMTEQKGVTELNQKLYYCSKGLKTAVEIKRGRLICEMNDPNFENEFVKLKWFDGIVPTEYLCTLIE